MKTKHQGDTAIVRRMTGEAVSWFHESRFDPVNAKLDLWELSRQCANGAFQNNAVLIPVQRQEIIARKFMAASQLAFGVEVPKAMAERPAELSH